MSAYYYLDNLIRYLEVWGLADVLLPFILVFTIVFAVLQKSKLLGEERKNFNVIVALVVALSVVIPHALGTYPSRYDVVDIMNQVMPQIALVAIAFLMVLILSGLMGAKIIGEGFGGLFVIIALIAVIAVFGSALDWWNSYWFYNFFGEEAVAVVVMLLVFGLIIWFITSDSNKGIERAGEGVKKFLNFIMGKK